MSKISRREHLWGGVGTSAAAGLAVAAALVLVSLLSSSMALAQTVAHVTGGGTGTFDADLDGDGDVDGSHFGMGVVILEGGAAKGHFECLMAGNADILGLPLMAVVGNVTSGTVNLALGTASFAGEATVNLGNAGRFTNVPFQVQVSAGGPETGMLQLTVIGAFEGVPGDQVSGNGNYDLPPEVVATGQIELP